MNTLFDILDVVMFLAFWVAILGGFAYSGVLLLRWWESRDEDNDT